MTSLLTNDDGGGGRGGGESEVVAGVTTVDWSRCFSFDCEDVEETFNGAAGIIRSSKRCSVDKDDGIETLLVTFITGRWLWWISIGIGSGEETLFGGLLIVRSSLWRSMNGRDIWFVVFIAGGWSRWISTGMNVGMIVAVVAIRSWLYVSAGGGGGGIGGGADLPDTF